MGCSNSKDEQSDEEILGFCRADPDVTFSEEVIEINGNNRNSVCWMPKDKTENDVKGVVIISHGLLEHSLCYYPIAIPLAHAGYAVHCMDHTGHGLSVDYEKGDMKGVIVSEKLVVDDFVAFANKTRELYKDKPAFLLAHSLGGLIGLASMPSLKNITAAVFSGTALVPGSASASPWGFKCLYWVSKTAIAAYLTACLGTIDPAGPGAPLDPKDVIHDLEEVKRRRRDPRRCNPYACNKTAHTVLLLQGIAKEAIPKIEAPSLVIHGEDDNVCLKEGSEFIYMNLGTDISLRRFEVLNGIKHEPFAEPSPKSNEAIAMVQSFFDVHASR